MSKAILTYGEIGTALLEKGFTHVKVELEANLIVERSGSSGCSSCGGARTLTCSTCAGTGWVNCARCGRTGRIEGEGYSIRCLLCYYGERSEGNPGGVPCHAFGCIDGNTRCMSCRNPSSRGEEVNLDRFSQNFQESLGDISDKLDYYRAYRDGSVNTEVTMTLPSQDCDLLPAILKKFHDTCAAMTGTESYDIANAGMHISVMEGSDYNRLVELPRGKIRNFRGQMEKVISSLYLLACGDGKKTRSTHFREPKACHDDKYSAIYTHDDRMIEYRIFDPCYSNPDRMAQFMTTIVRTLRYYDEHETINLPGKEEEYGDGPDIDDRETATMCQIYSSPSKILKLMDELEHVYPDLEKLTEMKEMFSKKQITPSKCLEALATL